MTDRIITYAEAIREAIGQVMETDDSVFMLGEDIGIYGGAFGVSGDLYQSRANGSDRVHKIFFSVKGPTYAYV